MHTEKPLKILMIEEDTDYSKSLTASLSKLKTFAFSISCISTLKDAFHLLETEDFDIILLDLFLSESQGLLTLKKIHANNTEIPIVILTNNENIDLAINAVRYGAQDYLIKTQINSHFLSLSIRYAIERKKTEKYHREQIHFLQSVMDNIPSPLFLKDTDLLFSACNTAFETLIGISKNNIIGHSIFDIFDKQNGELIMDKEAKLLKSNKAIEYEISFQTKKKKPIEILFKETVHKRTDGTLAGLIGVAIDISTQKKMEKSLKSNNQQLELKVLEQSNSLIASNTLLQKQIISTKQNETSQNTEHSNLNKLIEVIKHLRSPEGCPWDKKQTHETLKPMLVEESSELLDAIDAGDINNICEELGDILMHIVFHSLIAEEQNNFTFNDVILEITKKMESRHPHIFGSKPKIHESEKVILLWEEIKKEEKRRKGITNNSILDGIPKNFPALQRASKLQRKAASIGFDWESLNGVISKFDEEIVEFKDALTKNNNNNIEEELGDLLFTMVNICRFRDGKSAEELLKNSSNKFEKRFRYIEKNLKSKQMLDSYLTINDLEELWTKAKSQD